MKDMNEHRVGDVTDTLCRCGETHKGHICWLSRMELFIEIQHLTDNPTVACSECGAKANMPHNVCFPKPLGDE